LGWRYAEIKDEKRYIAQECDPAENAGQAANEDEHSCVFAWTIKTKFFLKIKIKKEFPND
jgi:hypothetical protein